MQHVIFDLDGTLVDGGHLEEAFRPVLMARGADPVRVEDVIATRLAYQSIEASVQDVMPGLSDAQAHDVACMMWEGAPVGDLLPGALDALAACQDLGLHVYLSTGSAPSLLERTLVAHGWADAFIAAHGSTPDFDKGLHHMQALAGVAGQPLETFCANALTVGDGMTEMRLGREWGMPYRVALTADDTHRLQLETAGATHTLTGIGELPEFLRALPAANEGAATFSSLCR